MISIPILVRFILLSHMITWIICCISIRFPLFVTCRWLFQLSTIIWFNRWFSIIFSIIRYCVIDWDSFSVACFSFVLNDHWFWIPIYTYPGSFYKDDDARLGQTTQGGVSSVSSVRTQPEFIICRWSKCWWRQWSWFIFRIIYDIEYEYATFRWRRTW